MAPTGTNSFQHEQAPCGRYVDGQCHDDQDDEGLIIHDLFYTCGCRSIRHEYHDGSCSRRVVHHNGHVLLDEFIAEHR